MVLTVRGRNAGIAISRMTAGTNLKAADLDGDGRDELLVSYDGRVHAWDRDLKELWCWPSRVGRIGEVVPGMAGRQGEVILAPGGGFDAKTGRPQVDGPGAAGRLAASVSACGA